MRTRISRRRWLKVSVGGVITGIAGCTGSPEGSADDTESSDEATSTPTATRTPTPLPRETLHDERIYTHERWPHEFEAGTTLIMEFDVIEGGPATFVFNETEYEGDIEDISYRIDTEKTITHEILTSGLTYLEPIPRGEAKVLVEVVG